MDDEKALKRQLSLSSDLVSLSSSGESEDENYSTQSGIQLDGSDEANPDTCANILEVEHRPNSDTEQLEDGVGSSVSQSSLSHDGTERQDATLHQYQLLDKAKLTTFEYESKGLLFARSSKAKYDSNHYNFSGKFLC